MQVNPMLHFFNLPTVSLLDHDRGLSSPSFPAPAPWLPAPEGVRVPQVPPAGPPPCLPQIPPRPLTFPHTRQEFGPKRSARFDQPSPKAEVGELLQVQPRRRGERPRHEEPIPLGGPGRGEQDGGQGLPAFRPRGAPGPQGTPSTFKEASSTTAPQPRRRCAHGEAPRAEPAPPSPPPPARDPGRTPGPPSRHPAPTSAGASPLRAHPPAPPPPPPRARDPDPGQPDAALPRRPPSPAGAPPRLRRPPPAPAPPSPYPAPRRDAAPSDTADPADGAPPTRPSPCVRRSWRARTRRSPGQPPALSAARSRLLQPGTRRDIRARIPTPGLFLGDRPRPDRNSFLPPRMRTRPRSSVSLRQPRLSLPCPQLPLCFPPRGLSSRADLSSRCVLEHLGWERRGRGQRVTVEASPAPQGREGRTMFFRVGEETDHPAQEGDDGGRGGPPASRPAAPALPRRLPDQPAGAGAGAASRFSDAARGQSPREAAGPSQPGTRRGGAPGGGAGAPGREFHRRPECGARRSRKSRPRHLPPSARGRGQPRSPAAPAPAPALRTLRPPADLCSPRTRPRPHCGRGRTCARVGAAAGSPSLNRHDAAAGTRARGGQPPSARRAKRPHVPGETQPPRPQERIKLTGVAGVCLERRMCGERFAYDSSCIPDSTP
ncbi:basic proline-rich protein-like [Canis lupus familiaris]|uniref:basic proline-rich protein-like n=1 Tax=Canis lupus familiaris TaxID=9615 RepID=UPI0018F40900|nr:basic proline-rich protein-like [Canis lupus familiaris]